MKLHSNAFFMYKWVLLGTIAYKIVYKYCSNRTHWYAPKNFQRLVIWFGYDTGFFWGGTYVFVTFREVISAHACFQVPNKRLRGYLPESAKVTTDGCLKVFSLLTATIAELNLSLSEQTNTETGDPFDLRVPEWRAKTPAPRVWPPSTWAPRSQEKLLAELFDHHDENILRS